MLRSVAFLFLLSLVVPVVFATVHAGVTRTYDVSHGQELITIVPGDTVLINYDGGVYPLEGLKIARGHAMFTISGKPYRLEFRQTRTYDLDNDHRYDLAVSFVKNQLDSVGFGFAPAQHSFEAFPRSERTVPKDAVEQVQGVTDVQPGEDKQPAPTGSTALPADQIEPDVKKNSDVENDGEVKPVQEPVAETGEVELTAIVVEEEAPNTSAVVGLAISDVVWASGWLVAAIIAVLGTVLYFVVRELLDW